MLIALFILLFMFIGLFAGVMGSLVGIGGGMFFVPALLYFGNMYDPGSITPQIASGTSLLVIAITALSSSISFLKQKKVDVQAAVLFFIGSAPGAIVGVYVNKWMDSDSFYLLFGLFQISMFILLLIKDKFKPKTNQWKIVKTYLDEHGEQRTYGYNRTSAIIIAFFVGVISSLFGVGGGILMVPALLVLYRFPAHMATATSMCIIFLSAVVGSTTNIINDHIQWFYVLGLAPGAWIGGSIGAIVANKLKGKTLILLLRIMILAIAVQMIYKALVA
ncbi:sulfite exporter TauE/SafE family protein [Brevibacillus laterosporus]|uniref:Probable membrane transporter protein n=1 Tax=Brevibacillus laterosporus TaxID=1465 RepID=A0AAP3DCK6_BRELA|nr:sulfite exporter TauE/SafE family protein [Brevibacillus laterosporus]MCR8978622.1 sulfite exporter TauE/SafE family protein [Brevibacillus laterosporus]MCZ0805778.1 sulfite exporter TauE/SafE family protein [Brevibacillus laterosporus]MCZ0824456.1 sulfite exporter TauE/SafE family protein [Brevibacillus laterosporus]MCZ0848360.1 sulfite exporter TauE/SafE family protein [Brevibacillus laterosporus]MED1662936.1 sulfite exporter TauE/SafE family protein [Brevibacillus laterosporus]